MAYDFNGSSQYMTVGAAAATTPPITLACWFKPDVLDNVTVLALDDAQTYTSFRLQLRDTGVIHAVTVNADASSAVFADSTAAASTGAWFHSAAVFGSTASRYAYLNGAPGTQNTSSLSVSIPTRTIIGAVNGSRNTISQYVDANLAEAAIWNAALTDAEILSLARGFTPDQIRPQSLQFYAPLVRELRDLRGGRTITNNGGATVAIHPRIIT